MSMIREQLIAAKALIDVPSRWCQGQYERDGRMCASMALQVATHTSCYDIMDNEAYEALRKVMDVPEVCTFNDRHTHAQVMAAFDKAIAATEGS